MENWNHSWIDFFFSKKIVIINSSMTAPLPHGGEPQPLSGTGTELQAEDVPQVFLPVGLLVPEDAQPDLLGGEPQHCDGFVVRGLPQVDAIYL